MVLATAVLLGMLIGGELMYFFMDIYVIRPLKESLDRDYWRDAMIKHLKHLQHIVDKLPTRSPIQVKDI